MKRRPPRRRAGIALVFVVLSVTMILATWGLANRQTVALVRLKERLAIRESARAATDARRLALAYGLALLETGLPPIEPGETAYECEAIITWEGVTTGSYIVRFEQAGIDQWSVSARARGPEETGTWPHPDRFPPPDEEGSEDEEGSDGGPEEP
jgi:hypothetical protein